MLADSIPKGDIAFQRRTTTTTTRGARFEPLKCFYSSLNEETNSFDLHTTSIACASHPRHDSTRGNSTPPPIGSYHIPFASVAHISHFDTLVLPSEGCAAKRVFIAFSAQSSRASELFLLQSTLAAAAAPRAASDATGRACRMVRVALDQEIGCSSNRRLMAVDSHLSITSIRALHGIGFLISFGESQQQQVSLLPLRSLKILFNNPIDLQHSANSSANLSSPNAATLLHTIQLYPSKLVNASEACVEPTEGGSVCRFSDSCCSRRLFSSTTQCLKKLWRKVVEDGAVDEIVQGGFILALGTYLSDKHLQIFILNSNLDLLNYNLDSSGSIRVFLEYFKLQLFM